MDQLAGSRELRRRMGEAGLRRYEERFTVDAFADRFAAAVERWLGEAVAGGGRGGGAGVISLRGPG